MINRFRIKIARRIEKLKEQYDYFRFRYLRSKWNVTILISLLILFVSLFVANNFYAYYMTKNYINIFQVKSTIVSFIRKNLGKAIEIGIADFSSLQGIIFEDIKISQEEDFSNNKLLFTSKRVDVRLTSLFSKAVVPNKIFVYSAKIILDIDDPINTNVLKYIHELNLPDIYFDNLEIQIKSGNQDLLRSVENINVSISRREQFLDITFNDSQFFGLVSGSVKGSGKINLESGENTLRIDFSKHDLDAMEGITNTLINLVPESGYAEGFISLNKTKEDFSLDGNLNFRNFSGDFFTISNIRAKDLTINAKFSYLKEFIDQKTSQSYFKRKISTTEFFYEEQIDTPPNNLKKTTVAIQVNNLDKLFDRLIFEDDFQVKGNMKINMRLEETGKVNDWIWIDGNGSIGNLEIYSKNPEFSLTNTTLKFNWNQNELHSEILGKLFDQGFTSELNGVISFLRQSKETPTTGFASNLKWNTKVDRLILKSFQSIYDAIDKKISGDIKERQEKMLPESFFIQSTIYKVFLEKANVKKHIEFEDVKYRAYSHSLGKYIADLKIEAGAGNLNLSGGSFSKSENEMNLNFYYDRKMPSFDFRVKLGSLLWFDETLQICDSSVYSDIINFNMAFISSGNNFSDLLANRSINGELSLIGNSFIRTNPADNINLSEIFQGQNNLNISMGFNAYSQEGFYRNIEIKSKENDLRGNANMIRSDVNYFLYGQIKNKPYNLSFTKTGASCQKLKK